MSIIIGFSGKSGSGKTTLSESVAQALRWPRVSFGEYVRRITRQQGLAESIKNLQTVGESLAKNPDEFCRLVLKTSSWRPGHNIIIDGIRHKTIYDSLHKIIQPKRFILIFIEIDENTRESRLAKRGYNKEVILNIEKHSTEKDVKRILKEMSDIVLTGNRTVNELSNELLERIRTAVSEYAMIDYL